MQDPIAALHGTATLIFVAGSALVGGRLLLLAHRTRQAPELLLGAGIVCLAVLGYGTLIVGLVLRGGNLEPEAATPWVRLLSGMGKTLHDVGVTLYLIFVLRVFRPHERWARWLAAALLVMLWGGLVGNGVQTGFRADPVGSFFWFSEYLVIWTYALWAALESLRWWLLMRRRAALGLADPLVTNRFLLWGAAAALTTLATWTASLPYTMVGDLARIEAVTPAVRVATAALGIVSITCSYFAFLPPTWYRRRIEGTRGAAHPAAVG